MQVYCLDYRQCNSSKLDNYRDANKSLDGRWSIQIGAQKYKENFENWSSKSFSKKIEQIRNLSCQNDILP